MIMTATESTAAQVEIVEVEPQLIAMVLKTVAFADLPQAQREARNLLDAALRDAGIGPSGRTITVWRPP
jgi:hypothetical protein